MANEQNLKPLNLRPERERKEIARMGAAASNKAQANKRVLREAANVLLAAPATNKEAKTNLRRYGLSDSDCTNAVAVVAAQLKNAIRGDTRAFNAIRDIIGEKPKESDADNADDKAPIINIRVMPATEADAEASR